MATINPIGLGMRRSDFSVGNLAMLSGFAFFGFAGVFLAALGFNPAVTVLAYLGAAALHAGVVALAVGLTIELIRPSWTFLGWVAHVAMFALFVVLAIGVFFLDRFVLNLSFDRQTELLYIAACAGASIGVAVVTVFVLSPNHFRGPSQKVAVYFLAGLAGLVAGAGIMALVVAGLAAAPTPRS